MNLKNQSHYSSSYQYQPVKSSEFIQDEFLIEDLTVKNRWNHSVKTTEFYLNKGNSVVLSGTPGIGKSTFFKIISDLYPHYDGVIKVAKRKILFLSQDAYFPVGGLAHATSYPEPLLENDLNFIKQVLLDVGFSAEFID